MADPAREDMYKNWQRFVHRRAYRKLAFRVKMFTTHWGQSPFDILHANISTISAHPELPKMVELALPEFFIGMANKLGIKSSMQLPLKPGEKVARCGYVLDSESLKSWIKLLRYVWAKICDILIVANHTDPNHMDYVRAQIRRTTPDASETPLLVKYIQGLRKLRPLIHHLFSLDCLNSPLQTAGRSNVYHPSPTNCWLSSRNIQVQTSKRGEARFAV
jgi:hypothetical protein